MHQKSYAAGLLGSFVSMTQKELLRNGVWHSVTYQSALALVTDVLCDPGIPGTFGLIGECYVRGLMKGRYVEDGLRLV